MDAAVLAAFFSKAKPRAATYTHLACAATYTHLATLSEGPTSPSAPFTLYPSLLLATACTA